MSKNKHRDNAPMHDPVEKAKPVMAKAPVVSQDGEEVTINLQPYLLPLSIVVSAVIIAVAILLSGRGGTATTVTAGNQGATPTAAVDQPQNDTASTTSIADSPYLGNRESAKIAFVEFSDYECPFCQRHHQQVYPDIVKNYVDSGKAIYVYRNYIAVPSHNPAATTEAYAALCIRELTGGNNSKYFQYADLIYANTGVNGAGIQGGKTVYTLGSEVGVDPGQLQACVESAKYKDVMTRDEQAAQAAGIQGTPGFVVGVLKADGTVEGKIIAGAYPFTEFQRVAEEMLAK